MASIIIIMASIIIIMDYLCFLLERVCLEKCLDSCFTTRSAPCYAKTLHCIQEFRYMERVLAKSKFYLTLVLVLVLIIAWPVPQFPQAGLDGSWRIALTQLVPDDYQSVPVIFTYGMWGDLVRGAFIKENAFSIISFRSIVYVLYAYLLIAYLHASKNIWFVGATFFLGILAAVMSLFMPYFQTEFELAILPILFLCFEPFSKHLNKIITILCVASGFVFFTKTSLYYYIFPTTLLYAACRAYLLSSGGLLIKSTKVLLKTIQCSLLSFGSVFIFGAIGLGQVFTQYSLLKDISSGYSSGMNSSGPVVEIVLACLLAVSIFISSILVANSRYLTSSRNLLIVRIIPSLYIIMLSFKHAFVRQGHAPRFFLIQSFVFLAVFSGLTFSHSQQHEMKILKAQLIAFAALLFSLLASILIPLKYMVAGFDFYGGQFRRHVDTYAAFIGSAFGASLYPPKNLSLPENRRLSKDELFYIGTKTIDVIPGEISIPYFYDLNWMPRPTLQSYQGYTPRLDNLNAEHLNSSGPEIILFHPDAIDHKHVSFFSPLEYQSFICNYQKANLPVQMLRSPSLTIFDRLGHSRCSSPILITKGKTPFNDLKTIKMPSKPGLLVLKLDIKSTWIGKFTELALRAPKLEIVLTYSSRDDIDNQIVKRYAFSYRTAPNGLTIWPELPDQVDDLLQHCDHQKDECSLDSNDISFSIQTKANWFFKDKVDYEIVKFELLS